MNAVIQNKADENRRQLAGQIPDVYFIKNVRASNDRICLSVAYRIVKKMRTMDFTPDEISLARMIVSEDLKNTKEMRKAVMAGIEITFKEAELADIL